MTGFPDIFVFESVRPASSHYLSAKRHPKLLLDREEDVLWAVQQQPLRRDKRDVFYYDSSSSGADDDDDEQPKGNYGPTLMDDNAIYGGSRRKQPHREQAPIFNDELWEHEWYLVGINMCSYLNRVQLSEVLRNYHCPSGLLQVFTCIDFQ